MSQHIIPRIDVGALFGDDENARALEPIRE